MKNYILIILLFQFINASDNYYYSKNQKEYLTLKNDLLDENSSINYYKNNKGIILGVTNKIIVKLKDGIEVDILLKEFNLILEKKIAKNLFLLKTEDKNLTIDISNQLNEDESTEYAQPDFIKQRFSR